jgi:hypothetical protein
MQRYLLVVLIIACVFYILAIPVAFTAYREFKGLMYDQVGGGNGGRGN